jgi:hypothetical protein
MSSKSPLLVLQTAAKIALFSELRLTHFLRPDATTNLAQPADIDLFHCCEHPHKSARADTCTDAASGNKIQFPAFRRMPTRKW